MITDCHKARKSQVTHAMYHISQYYFTTITHHTSHITHHITLPVGATGCLSSATQCHRSHNFISKLRYVNDRGTLQYNCIVHGGTCLQAYRVVDDPLIERITVHRWTTGGIVSTISPDVSRF